jgi:hypothetical protein
MHRIENLPVVPRVPATVALGGSTGGSCPHERQPFGAPVTDHKFRYNISSRERSHIGALEHILSEPEVRSGTVGHSSAAAEPDMGSVDGRGV